MQDFQIGDLIKFNFDYDVLVFTIPNDLCGDVRLLRANCENLIAIVLGTVSINLKNSSHQIRCDDWLIVWIHNLGVREVIKQCCLVI